jgi:hypothetical protein
MKDPVLLIEAKPSRLEINPARREALKRVS